MNKKFTCHYPESFWWCIGQRRKMLSEPRDYNPCLNCKVGRDRERELASTRAPRCGRCDFYPIPQKDSFCKDCLKVEMERSPENFIPPGDPEFCPEGHLIIPPNIVVVSDTNDRNSWVYGCRICRPRVVEERKRKDRERKERKRA